MSDYEQSYTRGYNDPTFRGYDNPRAVSDGQQARLRDEALHEEIMARYRYGSDVLTSQASDNYVSGSHSRDVPSLGSLCVKGLVLLLMVCWVMGLVSLK
jgi:hypothetical protein